jgi:hypothetical protein
MSYTNHSILCGACKRPVKAPADLEPHDKVTCSGCGQSDSLDKIIATAKDHAVYLAEQMLTESLTKATRGSSILKFKSNHVPNRSFRWMIEGGL